MFVVYTLFVLKVTRLAVFAYDEPKEREGERDVFEAEESGAGRG